MPTAQSAQPRHRRAGSLARLLGLVAVTGAVLPAGCRHGHVPDTAPEAALPVMRRPMWWGFYQRALVLSQRGQWRLAVADFEAAVGMRSGAVYPAYTDRRRAKTYGLHFLDDYFPHREMGVCLFYAGDWVAAERELLLSDRMLPSARARAYLNKVRRARLLGVGVDGVRFAAPRLALAGVEEGATLAQPFVTIKGEIEAAARVAALTVNGRCRHLELARRRVTVDERLRLQSGTTRVEVSARDLLGQSRSWIRTVTVDVSAPAVAIAPAPAGGPGAVTVIVTDDYGLSKVTLGDVTAVDVGGCVWRRVVAVPTVGNLRVAAVDAAGNRTEVRQPASTLAAMTGPLRRRTAARLGTAAVNGRLGAVAQPPDHTAPQVVLFPEVGAHTVVTTPAYMLDFLAHDTGGLGAVSLRVNGVEVRAPAFASGSVLGRAARRVELVPGVNRLALAVRDPAGNVGERRFAVERCVGCVWREDLRMSAAVLAPDVAAIPTLRPLDMEGMLTGALLQRPRRLRLLDRNHAALQALRREHGIRASRAVARHLRAPVGLRAAVEWVVQPYASVWAGPDNWDMVANLIDIRAGRIVFSADVHGEGYDAATITACMTALADKIRQRLPAISAPVAEVTRRRVSIPLGRRHQLVPGMRFVFLPHQAVADPFRAVPRAWGGRPVEAIVEQVDDTGCCARLSRAGDVTAADVAVLR